MQTLALVYKRFAEWWRGRDCPPPSDCTTAQPGASNGTSSPRPAPTKVYCRDCRYLDWPPDSPNEYTAIVTCRHPNNLGTHAYTNWYSSGSLDVWNRSPREINAANDCGWFEAKAPQTFTFDQGTKTGRGECHPWS